MRVLVACEFSGVVRDAFIAVGHDAVSCDLLPTEAPGPHHCGDVRDILRDDWDLMIAHPPCTFLTLAGARWLYEKPLRWQNMIDGAVFFRDLLTAPIPKIAVEEPDHAWLGAEDRRPGASAGGTAVVVRPPGTQGDRVVAEEPAPSRADQ